MMGRLIDTLVERSISLEHVDLGVKLCGVFDICGAGAEVFQILRRREANDASVN